jgi:cytolysin-activating lysine-acyltransferase
MTSKTNGAANGHEANEAPAAARVGKPEVDPTTLAKIAAFRARIHETVGKVALVLMATPRYRHLTIGDLQHLLLEPLMHDRVAIAQPKTEDGPGLESLAGVAIWASVDEATDAKIREQIKSRVFPIRLQANEWTSGKIHWLLDVIAPNERLATAVIANFKQLIKDGGDLRLHPMIAQLVDPEALKKMGAAPLAGPTGNKPS